MPTDIARQANGSIGQKALRHFLLYTTTQLKNPPQPHRDDECLLRVERCR